VLDRLKHAPETRHIPVHIVSGVGKRQRGLRQGALSYLEKPVSKEALDSAFERISTFLADGVKRLLVVEDDETQRKSIIELVGEDDVEITAVATAEDALRELSEKHYDCMVLDLGLQGMDGFKLLEEVKGSESVQDSCGATPRPSSSRMPRAPSGCWTRPRSSCTGWRPSSPTRSAGCWSGCTATTACSPARR
jgi:CheY-like chemotaxis protein